jgi:hypothetical protein
LFRSSAAAWLLKVSWQTQILDIMINLYCIILLVAGLASCTAGQEKTVETVIPIRTDQNRTLVAVQVGNVVIPDLILDTGFPYDGVMIYNPDYRDSLDLTEAMEVSIGGAGGGDASRALLLDSAQIILGDLTLSNQRIILLQGDLYRGYPSNGVIGYSIFGHYATEFDYDKKTMILYPSGKTEFDDSWEVVPLYFKDNNVPWLDISVVIEEEEPVSLSAYIDFASGDAILLLEKPGMKFTLPRETDSVHLGRGLSGDIYGETGIISKLIIGSRVLEDVKASFADAAVRSKQENADAILGNRALMGFNLVFDYLNKRLYLKPNTRFAEPVR